MKTDQYCQRQPGLELPGVGLNPNSCLQTLIFESKSALNFNPLAKFQTFRRLTPNSLKSIPTLATTLQARQIGAIFGTLSGRAGLSATVGLSCYILYRMESYGWLVLSLINYKSF